MSRDYHPNFHSSGLDKQQEESFLKQPAGIQ